MNQTKNKDFFPEIDERDLHLAQPDIYEPYQETEEDLLHEKRLKEYQARLDEKFGVEREEEWGELPYDEAADRKRWDELERDFDRVFEQAKEP